MNCLSLSPPECPAVACLAAAPSPRVPSDPIDPSAQGAAGQDPDPRALAAALLGAAPQEGGAGGDPGQEERLEAIRVKLQGGKRLTTAERQYLSTADPVAYAQVLSAEAQRRRYERQLRECRTREEVEALRLSSLGQSLGNLRSVAAAADPGSGAGQSLLAAEGYRAQGLCASTTEFAASREYRDLPTDRERRIERRERERELRGAWPQGAGGDPAICADPGADGETPAREGRHDPHETLIVDGRVTTYGEILRKARRTRQRLLSVQRLPRQEPAADAPGEGAKGA
ncbi:MAG: hypothetical protein K6A65_08660 [Succinivibrionaceae bacterium]|nr:hypothetical protein [Succinivibrionaceae bacterium]